MGAKNPERERLWGAQHDPLTAYVHGYEFEAHCRRSSCEHCRPLHIALLLKAFGPDAKLGQVAARLRCSRCGTRGARIQVRYVGRWGDGR
jgi:hypothetical protein